MDPSSVRAPLQRLLASRQNLAILVMAILILFFGTYAITGYLVDDSGGSGDDPVPPAAQITTFTDSGGQVCLEDGKPVVRLYSTTWCPHCTWIKDTFESTVQEYVDQGLIVAKHWELDINDDTLTPEAEGVVPPSEMDIYRRFNPRGSIPTFVFGCRYSRIGNGHESQGDLAAEEAEFRAVIEALLSEA